MNLDRALQVNTAALAVMGALFLGLGHESVVLPLALGGAAALSVWLVPRLGWLRLNRVIANLIAVGAVLWSLRNFLRIGGEDQLLAIADMLVYLQIVLFFQEKTARVYWQLIVLSLLQVVVAAALSLGPEFGLLLAAYMALAISALVLLCLYREWKRYSDLEPATSDASTHSWQSLLDEPVARVPPATAAAVAAMRPAPIARQAALLAAATLAFAGVFFYATPRLREGSWSDHRDPTQSTTGFVTEAVLEDSGRIHQSNQLVMRVVLSSALDRRSYPLVSEPYFHGLALTDYVPEGSRGRWIVARPPRISARLPLTPPSTTQLPLVNLVRQDIMLEGGAPQLFAISPVHLVQETASGIQVLPFSGRMARPGLPGDQRSMREFRYTIATSGLRNGRHLRAYPHRNRALSDNDRFALEEETRFLLRYDRQQFAGLAAVAEQVVKSEGGDQLGPLEQALSLERHFHALDRYHYSLNLNFTRDERLDPIEDFVVNHRTGHCEYFASALIMMLRSRGIPARMVIGYKGGDFNSIGGYFQVRQKHSHAWVEALLPPEATPTWELAGTPSAGGFWYRLDPTPSSIRTTIEDEGDGPLRRVMQAFDYVELLWRDYVLSLNAEKQHDQFYDPVSSRAFAALPAWLEAKNAGRLVRWLAAQVGLDADAMIPQGAPANRVLDWRSGSIAFLLIIVGVIAVQGLYYGSLFVRRWLPTRGGRWRRTGQGPPRFYRRLEALLARLRLRRATGQTARELAAAAADRLNHGGQQSTPAESRAAELPAEIVAAYYRVRFGGAALDSYELAAIEQALAQLSPAVNQASP